MVPPARRTLLFSLLAIVLLLAFFLQSFLASRIKTPAYDETGDIAAGLSYVRTGKFTVNPQHPPLLKELSGLFMLAAGARWPDTPEARQLLNGRADDQWPVGSDIILKNGERKLLFWARLPMILVATGMGIVLYLWGSRMLGNGAALGALFLFALDPNVLAHSYLVTLDVGLAAFALLFFFALWSYLRNPSLRRMLWCGLAMGAMLATKFSAPVLLPVAELLLFAAVCRPPEQARGRVRKFFDLYAAAAQPQAKVARKLALSIGAFAALCVIAVVVVQATYMFPGDPLLYLKGLSLVNADHNATYMAYLAGTLSPSFLSYFAAAYFLKEPLATISLVLVGLVVLLRGARVTLLDKAFLLLPPVTLFLAHTFLADDLGIRYIIPVMPFAYLIGGMGLAWMVESAAFWKRLAAAALAVWLIVAAIGIYPDHLSYFNEAACLLTQPGQIGWDGGSRCGTYWLDDSNVDWSEGLQQLKTWLARHAPGRRIRLAYFGTYPPANYALPLEDVDPKEFAWVPPPGLYVISAHVLVRLVAYGEMDGNHTFAWMRRIPPTAIVGHCLYVWDIPQN